jgi:SAM-dependent methyltransferase
MYRQKNEGKMKGKILAIVLTVGRSLGARWFLQQLNRGIRAISSFTHYLQHLVEWGRQPNPEWYDHFLDQHCFWTKTGIAFSWERGIFSLLAMKQGAKVLEVCCGDGFNAHHFYANRAANIIAVDFDPKAIQIRKAQF